MFFSWKWVAVLALVASLCFVAQAEDASEDVSRAMRYIMAKRKPSIGLSLAEYMAEGGKGDNFHFLPSRK